MLLRLILCYIFSAVSGTRVQSYFITQLKLKTNIVQVKYKTFV